MNKESALVIALLIVVVVGIIYFFMRSNRAVNDSEKLQAKVTTVSGEDFINLFKQSGNAIMMDVRTPAEYGAGHIAQAQNVDYESNSFASQIDNLDKSKKYFVYCRSGNRSSKAIAIMKEHGFLDIVELSGGISTWPNLLNAK